MDLMAKTFRALCDYADWSGPVSPKKEEPEKKDQHIKPEEKDFKEDKQNNVKTPELHYNIQIHLPESRDPSVYDAIFKSLKEHFN